MLVETSQYFDKGLAVEREPSRPPAPAVHRDTCTQCRKQFEQTRAYKTCPSCREKNRNHNRRAKERRDQKAAAEWLKFARGDLSSSSDMVVDENDHRGFEVGAASRAVVQVVPVANTASAALVGKKRPAPSKALDEMEGEERRVALAVMKNGLKHAAIQKGNKRVATPMRITSTAGEGKEYQTATALYEDLKTRAAKASAGSNILKFNGFHAIIANSTIDNQKRVELVSKDLRKIARVRFDHRNPTPLYDFETMGRIATYTCRCLGGAVAPGAPPPASSKTTMKGTQGDLIRQARLSQEQASQAGTGTVPRVCGGKVKITAVDDGRHPLGILAQRISISIDHPAATSRMHVDLD